MYMYIDIYLYIIISNLLTTIIIFFLYFMEKKIELLFKKKKNCNYIYINILYKKKIYLNL